MNNEHVTASLQEFSGARDEIYALVSEQEGLDSGVKKRLFDYIDKSYDLIDNPKAVEKKFIKRCV